VLRQYELQKFRHSSNFWKKFNKMFHVKHFPLVSRDSVLI